MTGMMLLISVASTLLFALLVLIKLGTPVIIAAPLAIFASYAWWRIECADDEKKGLADYWCALTDVKDILKYVNRLF